MVLLKMLWKAGADPVTPWLEMVFADFADGGDGSKFKKKAKIKPVGQFILHRFNGNEEYALEKATIQVEKDEEGRSWLILTVETNGTVIKSLPDTETLSATPNAEIFLRVATEKIEDLIRQELYLPFAYDEQRQEHMALMYYLEHQILDANIVKFIAKKKDKYQIKWTSQTVDINYYDGSKPNTEVEIIGWFTITR